MLFQTQLFALMHEQLQGAQANLFLLCHGWESICAMVRSHQSNKLVLRARRVFVIALFLKYRKRHKKWIFRDIVIFRQGNKEMHTLWLVAKILKCICTRTIIIAVNIQNYSVLVYISLTLKFSLNLEKEWFYFPLPWHLKTPYIGFIRFVPGTRYLYTRNCRIINAAQMNTKIITLCSSIFFCKSAFLLWDYVDCRCQYQHFSSGCAFICILVPTTKPLRCLQWSRLVS